MQLVSRSIPRLPSHLSSSALGQADFGIDLGIIKLNPSQQSVQLGSARANSCRPKHRCVFAASFYASTDFISEANDEFC